MRFLAIMFGTLTLLSLAWLCGGSAYMLSTSQQLPDVNNPSLSVSDNRAVNSISHGVVDSLSVGFFACTGIPAAALFLLLTFACNSSAQAHYHFEMQRRYQEEMLYSQRERNDVLGAIATAQITQTQIQYNELRNRQSQQQSSQRPYLPNKNPGYRFPDEEERGAQRQNEFLRKQNERRKQQGWYKNEE